MSMTEGTQTEDSEYPDSEYAEETDIEVEEPNKKKGLFDIFFIYI